MTSAILRFVLAAGVVCSTAWAQLVTPPTVDWVSLPSSASVGQSVSVGVGAHANYSDNSDGNDWNSGTRATIARIMIAIQRPGQGDWTMIHDWLNPWRTPADAWASFTINNPGTHWVRVELMDGRPWYSDPLYYTISVPTPSPAITSQLSVSYNQNQAVGYQISATNSPTSFSASGLPPGVSLNTGNGYISGNITQGGTYYSTITAANAYGSDSKTLTWNVTGASHSVTGSITPVTVIHVGGEVTLNRSGSANFGIAWFENSILRPNGTWATLGNSQGGAVNWTPDGGIGTYQYRLRLVDNYYNYTDQWIPFYVNSVSPLTVSTSAGQTFNIDVSSPAIEFGQSVTVSGTMNDPAGRLTTFTLHGNHGISGHWETYSGSYVDFGAKSSHPFAITYQPPSRRNGAFTMYPHGYSGGWWARGFVLTVNKSTPNGTFSSRSYAPNGPGSYTLSAADLNATFSNAYSGSVEAPTGAVSYRLANGTPLYSGTAIGTGSHTVEAVYPGDSNYNSRVLSATFTIAGPTTPTSFQATTTGSTYVTLAWQASSSPAGIKRYEILRNGVVIGTATSLSYTDSTTQPGMSYSYSVRAVDNSDNVSGVASLNSTTARVLEVFTPLP